MQQQKETFPGASLYTLKQVAGRDTRVAVLFRSWTLGINDVESFPFEISKTRRDLTTAGDRGGG